MITCRICGETDENVGFITKGVMSFAHGECTKNADVIVDVFLESVVMRDDGLIYLAEELIKAQTRVSQSSAKGE